MDSRKSAFNGSFYPNSKTELEGLIKKYISSANVNAKEVENAFSYVAPHAGYIYSGKTAAYTYKAVSLNKRLQSIDTIVIMGPNHTGIGTEISVSSKDWETILGKVETDKELAKEICSNSEIAVIDETAHRMEHSIEVQLPFLQYLKINKRFVFICMGAQNLDVCENLSNAILKATGKLGRNCLVVASSDFNHYESAKIGEEKDRKLFKELERLAYENFNMLVHEINDSACGYGAITVAAMFAKSNKAKKGVLLDYSNSGNETGDFQSVVDYASLAFI
jgi:hypothetical protein